MTENVFIGLGSNLGESALILHRAWKTLGDNRFLTTEALSSPYISSPVDMTSHHWFTNAVGRLTVDCSPEELLDILIETEALLGRTRDQEQKGYEDRTLDLDLIYFDSVVLDHPRLTIPHPRLADRLFVLAPMAAIAPDFVDPQTGKTVGQMHQDLVEKIETGVLAVQELSKVSWPESSGRVLGLS